MQDANLVHTSILDYHHPLVLAVVDRFERTASNPRVLLQSLHQYLVRTMVPVWSWDERMPVSELFRRAQGSSTQRMSCLEALARAFGIPTRVRALWIDRSFWARRLPLPGLLLPKRVLVPWPQFQLENHWVDFDELYGSTAALAAHAPHPFSHPEEPFFNAIDHVPVDLLGKAEHSGFPAFSLAHYLAGQGGFYDTRDHLLSDLEKRSRARRLLFRLTCQDKLEQDRDI